VNPPPGSGPATGASAFGRLRSSASQAKRPHPWGLVGALLVCAVLRTRQDRGWASCPTRPRHASGPWRLRSCIGPPPPLDSFRGARTGRAESRARAKAKKAANGCLFRLGSDPFAQQRALTQVLQREHPRMAWIYCLCSPLRRGEAGRDGSAGLPGTVGAMGPRHVSGGLGRTPNPGLAVCAGQRTRARRHRAPMDGFTACPGQSHPPGPHSTPTYRPATL